MKHVEHELSFMALLALGICRAPRYKQLPDFTMVCLKLGTTTWSNDTEGHRQKNVERTELESGDYLRYQQDFQIIDPLIYVYGSFLKKGYPQIILILVGFSILNHLFWVSPIYGNPHI